MKKSKEDEMGALLLELAQTTAKLSKVMQIIETLRDDANALHAQGESINEKIDTLENK